MATILVVDDDEHIRRMCVAMLSGHDCLEAENGQSALTQFKENSIDVVLTDLTMPVMDGIELIQNIRAINPTVPIVVMTGNANDHQQVLQESCPYILEKPFDIDGLVNAMQPWL